MQAVEWGKKLERENFHRMELPTALGTSVYANSQKTKPPFFSPYDFCFYVNPDEIRLDSVLCDTFAQLGRDEKLPGWVLEYAPVEELKKNTKGDRAASPRAWQTRGIFLLAPSIQGELVEISMAVLSDDAPSGKVTLYDVDSGDTHTLIIPPGIPPGSHTKVKWMEL